MNPSERKEKLAQSLIYLRTAQKTIDRHLKPIGHISNNFYEELVEYFSFMTNERERLIKALVYYASCLYCSGGITCETGCVGAGSPRYQIAREALGDEK